MCGIAGIFNYGDGEPVTMEVLMAMTESIVHRGPDADGFHIDGALGLGMRRLRIIDLETGDQPISNEDGSVWTVFNGEIYNYRELRSRLEAKGHVFRTRSDTEVIVHQYEEDGPACVERFRGMFAIAVWDAGSRELVLMRDRFGIKPLFVAHRPGKMAFGSEIKELLALDWVDRRWRPEALRAFLRLDYVPAPLSAYEGVRKMLPGTTEVWRERGDGRIGMVTRRRYWRPTVAPVAQAVGYAQAVETVRGLLEESIRLRLRTDVPLGVFLSGGIDSTTVVALMRSLGVDDLKTFSIGFAEKRFDEISYADQIARRFSTDHHRLVLSASDVDALPSFLDRFDEPFADSSAIPTYFVSRLARERVTVALSGDGGDEVFGGYDHYRHLHYYRWLDRLPHSLRAATSGVGARVIGETRRGGGFVRKLGAQPEQRLLSILYPGLPEVAADALGAGLRGLLAGAEDGGWLQAFVTDHSVAGALQVDQSTYLVDDILTKTDRSSMAVSLEARVPLLDHRLAEYVNGLPASYKITRSRGKVLLRDIVGHHVPAGFFERPKTGFSIPLRSWLTGPWESAATSLFAEAPEGMFDERGVSRLMDLLRHSDRDLSRPVWGLLSLARWSSRERASLPW